MVGRSSWTAAAAVALIVLLGVPWGLGSFPAHLTAKPPKGAGLPVAPDAASRTPPVAPHPFAPGDTWYNVTASQRFLPPAAVGASVTFDALDSYVLLFGGCGSAACPVAAQTWSYAGGSWTNLTGLGPQPPARAFASMTYDSHDNVVLLFGGRGAGGVSLNDTWSYAGGTWTNLTNRSNAPSARYAAGIAFDRSDTYVVLFGGCGALRCPLNDTWRFSSGAWKNISAGAGTPPSARFGAAFAYDNGDGYALLFGGCGVVCPLGDTWTFARGHWAALTVTGAPPARSFAALSYDAGVNQTYLVGGNSSLGPRQETWRFNAAKWTNVTSFAGAGPSARFGMAGIESSIAWTSAGAKRWPYLLFVGGSRGACLDCVPGPLDSTFVFEPVVSITAAALPTVAEVGQPVTFTGTAAGGSPPYAYLWQYGDGASALGATTVHSFLWVHGFTARLVLSDSSGAAVNASALVTVVPGPYVTLSVTPTVTDVGRSVAFVGGASGGVGGFTFRWSFGDLTGANSASASHSYTVAGQFPVNLTATDLAQGRGVGYSNVTVNPRPELTAVSSNLTPRAGGNISFSASVIGGTAPFTFRWDFGDGNTSALASVVRAFERPGTYLVRASVVDAVGSASWENFSILVAPVGGSGGTGGVPLSTWLGWGAIAVGAVVALVAIALALHRRRRHPVAPIAAAAVGQPGWDSDDGPEPAGDSRSARRSLNRFYRRRS